MLRGHSLCAVVCLAIVLCTSPASLLACGPTSIFVRGRTESAPSGSFVTVRLVYEHGKVGESDRLLLDGSSFRTRIQFSTFPHMKCARQPQQVIVALMDGDRELDRVTLSVPQDFSLADPAEFAVREEIILHGKNGEPTG